MSNLKPTLETKRLLLRPPTPDDFLAYHSWGSNPENVRHMAWGPNDEEQTKTYLAQVKPGCDFAIVLKETGAVIGSCGIYPDEAQYMGELGWILHKDYWKQGYGTELGAKLIRYGFEDLKLGRIEAPCAAINYGSYRVMERNGMRREALHRKAFWARIDKEWVDKAEYAILADDYFAKASPLIGNSNDASTTVSEANTARALGSGSLNVFATPMMVALMEEAACGCLEDVLTEGETSVGVKIDVEHIAATAIGSKVSATAVIRHVSGRRIEFDVTAHDGPKVIGKGLHIRQIVDRGRFTS